MRCLLSWVCGGGSGCKWLKSALDESVGLTANLVLVQSLPLQLLQSLGLTPSISVFTGSDLLTIFCLVLFFCMSFSSKSDSGVKWYLVILSFSL